MFKIKSIITPLLVMIVSLSYAQTYELDAIKFGFNNYTGSARFVGVGGAFTSVGADITNSSHNPAGIGMFRNSMITITPEIDFTTSRSNYLGENSQASIPDLVLGNLGVVFAKTSFKNSSLLQSAAFGIGVNRVASFNSKQKFDAFNTDGSNSITYTWLNEISAVNDTVDGAVDFDNFSFEAVNAYQAYLVNFDTTLQGYTSPITNPVRQTRYVDISGGKSEAIISGGANYLNKVYFGATVGIPIISYERYTRFIEEDSANLNGSFQEFELQQNYETSGIGFNVKAGVIYKPTSFLRLGLALHSPERLSLSENYSSNISSAVFGTGYDYESPAGNFDYVLRLPWRMKAGASLFYKKHGFISFDYELVDYASTKYTFATDYEEIAEPVNDLLKEKYGVAHNFSVGLEGVIKKTRIRAGYNYIDSPLNSTYAVDGYNGSTHRFSGGFGVVWERFAFDLAGQYSMFNATEVPYQLPGSTPNEIRKENSQINMLATLSYKFR